MSNLLQEKLQVGYEHLYSALKFTLLGRGPDPRPDFLSALSNINIALADKEDGDLVLEHLNLVRSILDRLVCRADDGLVERLRQEFRLDQNSRLGAGLAIVVGLFGAWREEPVEKQGSERRYHWRACTLLVVRESLETVHPSMLRHELLRAIRPAFDAFYADCDQQDELGFAIDLVEYFTRGTNADIIATSLPMKSHRDEVRSPIGVLGNLNNTSVPSASPADTAVQELGLGAQHRYNEPILQQLQAICLTQCVLFPYRFKERIHLYLINPGGGVLRFELNLLDIEDNLTNLEQVLPDPRRYHSLLPNERVRDMRARRERMSDDVMMPLKCLYDHLFLRSEPLGGWDRNLAEQIDLWEGVYVVPTEEFPWLPWHLLHDGDQFLFERWKISYFPSLSVMYSVLTYRAGFTVGSPDVTIDDPRKTVFFIKEGTTNESSTEAREIRSIVEAHGLSVDEKAVEYGFVHLAGHGASSMSGLNYKVQHGDRWISTADVLNGALKSRAIMINACDVCALGTSLQDDIPLVLALFAAGNRNILGSCWPLRDTSAHKFAVKYYTALMAGQFCVASWRSALMTCIHEPLDLLEFGGYMAYGAIDDQTPSKLEFMGDSTNEDAYKLLQKGETTRAIDKFWDARIYYLRARCWEGHALTCENLLLCNESRTTPESSFPSFPLVLEAIASRAAQGLRGEELSYRMGQYFNEAGLNGDATWSTVEQPLGELLSQRGLSIKDVGIQPILVASKMLFF
ncbi:MAG: CHAT domain-containing protein [Candidatus Thiodiazotropha taylori]|nr:CHAT domain-containing protein [Candidatus Thiodiazotropha taylori]